VGSNCKVIVAVWLGFRVSGKLAPDAANPLPVSDEALIVTAALPVDDKVIVCVAGILRTTSPKSTALVLSVSVGPEALSIRTNVCDTPPALAVSVAVSDEVAGETFAVKLTLLAPAGTVTEVGTPTSEVLLPTLTANPPLGAAAFSVTVQRSVADPVTDVLAHVSELTTGTPAPLRLTTLWLPLEELLLSVSCPVIVPAAVGSNCTLSVVVCPGASVTGSPSPVIEKPLPDIVAALTVTFAVPIDDRTSDCVTAEFTGTVPNVSFAALRPNVGIEPPNCSANVCATPPALAVSVADCNVVTGATLAVKSALLAPAATITVAGTVTALFALDRFTLMPPLAAAAFIVTVQASVAAPVIDPLTQLSLVSIGTPVPLRATDAEDPLDALLAIDSWPVVDPDAEGANWRVSVTLAFAPTVSGRLLAPLIENECPVRFNSEISTAADPWFDTVTLALAVLPTAT
jgi:hypothetical protein